MSSKDQYKDYAARYKKKAAKLQREVEVLRVAIKQQRDIALAARTEIRELKAKISKMRFWRGLFGIKTPD